MTSTSYTLPHLNNVLGLSFVPGGHYTINFQLMETRSHVVFTNNNAEILRRSSSFFGFSPLMIQLHRMFSCRRFPVARSISPLAT